MMTDKLAIRDEALFPATLDGMVSQAKIIADSGLCPKGWTYQQVLAVGLRGRSLGIDMSTAVEVLYPIDQKISMYPEFMAAQIRQEGHRFKTLESTDKVCRIRAWRKGDPVDTYEDFEWTIEEATQAGLANKFNWKSYPKDTLYARCVSRMKRRYFQDVGLAKIYTPEELGAVVDADGKVIDSDNLFDREAARKDMKRQMKKWYPDGETQMAVWLKYKEEFGLEAKVPGELTNDEYAVYVKRSDPANQGSNIQEGVFEDTTDTGNFGDGVDTDPNDIPGVAEQEEIRQAEIAEAKAEKDKLMKDNPTENE